LTTENENQNLQLYRCGKLEIGIVVCAPDDGWKYHPKHIEQFPDINKL
jgi:hypothetical protein